MTRFYEFCSDIIWSVPAALAVLGLWVLIEFFGLPYRDGISLKERIALYESFARNDRLAENIRGLLGGSPPNSFKRLEALEFFSKPDTLADRVSLFKKLDPHTSLTLVYAPDSTAVLKMILKEKERVAKLRINWRDDLVWAFGIWKWATVVCLLVFWWRESYNLKYFPVTEWWFWIYILLAFPESSALCVIFGIPFLLGLRSKFVFFWRELRLNVSFKELCAGINGRLEETRQKWDKLFPQSYLKHRQQEVVAQMAQALEGIHALCRQLGEKQRVYFALQAESIALPRRLSEHLDKKSEGDLRKEQEEWREQLERIIALPGVKAVAITSGELYGSHAELLVYTGRFATFFGEVGPMKVLISLSSKIGELFEARVVTKMGGVAGSLAATAGRGNTFCFGETHQTISAFLEKRQMAEAVEIMIQAFQASSLDG